jgi:hypothetical protein
LQVVGGHACSLLSGHHDSHEKQRSGGLLGREAYLV